MHATRGLLAVALLFPGTAAADQIELPTSDAARVQAVELLKQLPNFRPDRLLASDVPGPVINDELVHVGVAGDGSVSRVVLDQRLRLEGTGDYAIRERGPAREARSLTSEPPPLTRKGAVVWQGFSPGSRDLAARLLLDPQIETPHLPLQLSVRFHGADGQERALPAGGSLPGAGEVTVTIRNVSEQPQVLPTGSDVAASAVAPLLDTALRVARHPSAARLPSTDDRLPRRLDVSDAAQVQGSQAVPFRLTGALRLVGTTGAVTGPATTALPDGARFAGVLGGIDGAPEVTFTAHVNGSGTLSLALQAIAVLDARKLAPPRGLDSWRVWARSDPPKAERKAALDLAVEVAATGARATSYSPFLGADLKGSGSTVFRYGFAPADKEVVVHHLEPKGGAIALAAFALLLILTNAGLLWTRL